MGEIKEVVIRLSSNPKVFQVIYIIVVGILKAYGMLLSRYWSSNLNGYFSTNWSHLILPWKGNPNQVRSIWKKKHMKYIVIELNHPNELVVFSNSTLGNYCFDTFFGEFNAETCNAVQSYVQSEVLHYTQALELNYTIVEYNKTNFVETKSTNIVLDTIFWNLTLTT
jgi:hypothetical protein